MSLIPCDDCGRHHSASDESCPFCATPEPRFSSPRSRTVTKAMHLFGGAVTTVVLAACYGVGGFEDFETDTDFDGDGYDSTLDCDDNNVDVYPGATEICDDGVDNDCDLDVDAADADCGGGDTDS